MNWKEKIFASAVVLAWAPMGCSSEPAVDGGGGSTGAGGGSPLPAKVCWAQSFGDGSNDQVSSLHAAGAWAVGAGVFDAQIDFGAGPVNGARDAFVVVTSADAGQVRWGATFGGAEAETNVEAVLDAAGDVYLSGLFREGATMGEQTIEAGAPPTTLVAKLAAESGEVLWVRRIDAADPTLAMRDDGVVIVGGRYKGNVSVGDLALEPSDSSRGYVAALDSADGSAMWASGLVGTANVRKLFPAGDSVLAAGFSTLSLDRYLFVARLDEATGAEIWKHQYGSSGVDITPTFAAGSDDSVVVGGTVQIPPSTQVDFGGDEFADGDAFLAAYGLDDGAHRWSRAFPSLSSTSAHVAGTVVGEELWWGIGLELRRERVADGSSLGGVPLEGKGDVRALFDHSGRVLVGGSHDGALGLPVADGFSAGLLACLEL